MKKRLLLFYILFFIFLSGKAKEFQITGIYQGKNVYVLNPMLDSDESFCIQKITVNGQEISEDLNTSAIEIDLSVYQFNIGDKIIITVEHKGNCEPQIINAEVLKAKSTFKAGLIKVDKKGFLNWTTTYESGPLLFTVEQFRWNKWIKVGEVMGKGIAGKNSYSVQVSPNTGINKFRLKQIDYSNKPHYSKTITYRLNHPAVTYKLDKSKSVIVFSDVTMYEIYDSNGFLIHKGIDNKVDISDLPKAEYYINYDNVMGVFKKK
ncbi:MAG: hypothetical protein GXO79_13680 [Chlorobi bacterium]|nr:hypothetical protein [Chlorobiota bacterium]